MTGCPVKSMAEEKFKKMRTNNPSCMVFSRLCFSYFSFWEIKKNSLLEVLFQDNKHEREKYMQIFLKYFSSDKERKCRQV